MPYGNSTHHMMECNNLYCFRCINTKRKIWADESRKSNRPVKQFNPQTNTMRAKVIHGLNEKNDKMFCGLKRKNVWKYTTEQEKISCQTCLVKAPI